MQAEELNRSSNNKIFESQQANTVSFDRQGKKTNKWLIIGLSLLSLFALGVAGTLTYQNYILKKQISKLSLTPKKKPFESVQSTVTDQTNTANSTPTIEPTLNWKTYKNSKYGFTFKYPDSWDFRELYSKTYTDKINFLQLTLAKEEYFNPVPKLKPYIMIDVIETTDRSNLSVYQNTEVVKNITVDGIEAEERKHKALTDDEKYITFTVNNVTFTIDSNFYSQDSELRYVFDQILSTFKFTH